MKRMMMFIGIWAGIILTVNAQTEQQFLKPDFGSIEKIINDKGSLFYYPNLFERYVKGDISLSLREYRLLYYGFVFQKEYSVMASRENAEQVQAVLEKENPTNEDWKTVIRVEKTYLQHAPFDMRDLHLVFIAYMELKDSAAANIYHDKILKIARTIMASGDGRTEASAFYVISVSHEYDLINLLGLAHTGGQKLTRNKCDYLELSQNEYNLQGMYFDVNQLFREYAKLLQNRF